MIGAMLSAAATMGNAGLNFWANERTNQNNREMAKEQREWEERMSNTAIQRRVKDANEANVNPLFALNSSGASTPTYSQIPEQAPNFDFANVIQAIANIKNLKADTKVKEATAENTKEATKNMKEMHELNKIKTNAEINNINSATKGNTINNDLNEDTTNIIKKSFKGLNNTANKAKEAYSKDSINKYKDSKETTKKAKENTKLLKEYIDNHKNFPKQFKDFRDFLMWKKKKIQKL